MGKGGKKGGENYDLFFLRFTVLIKNNQQHLYLNKEEKICVHFG